LRPGCVVVLDVGKTLSKLTIWSPDKQLIERRTHRNARAISDGYPTLDVKGIGFWLTQTLAAFARLGDIAAIVPVAHGAAACLIDDDGLCLPPLDYEAEPPSEVREQYLRLRDPFALTGSPSLPAGLNLGMQLFWLESSAPDKARRGRIVTWPQYWAWRLSGVAATEVTSLGCHTDLWIPAEGRPSPLAVARGWAERLAPLRRAGDVLGPVTEEWRTRCNLPRDCMVLCGLHDSNAALLATRGYPEVADRECTILSTGTWFVAMRAVAPNTKIDPTSLPEARDCLINVDVSGTPVPSSRFMGGREMELIAPEAASAIDPCANKDILISIAGSMVKEGVFALPTFQNGVGPFPMSAGRWIRQPSDQLGRRAVAGLYLALMANVSLDLIGSKETLVIEGRFADDPVFAGTLAALRRQQGTYLSDANNSLPYGALRLVNADLPPGAVLTRVEPLDYDLADYAAKWQSMVQTAEAAA
jgi:sugar (pentulose or hexulose) kinase